MCQTKEMKRGLSVILKYVFVGLSKPEFFADELLLVKRILFQQPYLCSDLFVLVAYFGQLSFHIFLRPIQFPVFQQAHVAENKTDRQVDKAQDDKGKKYEPSLSNLRNDLLA